MMVAKACKQLDIPISLGELLSLPTRTFQAISVTILGVKEKINFDIESEKTKRELLLRRGGVHSSLRPRPESSSTP
jgi:hypothetical protein